ncbi:MAG: glycoside hydrolase family 88 protein [Spirochaetia bacterium]|jgi:rhamnogalacturonyl hydrolase YesR
MKYLSIALADTIMARYPDPTTIPFRNWCYVHGYVLAGFEKLHDSTGEQKYFDYVRKYVDTHVSPRGDIPAFTGESLDDMLAGTAILAVFQRTGDARYRRAAETIRRSFEDYPRNSDGGFWHSRSLPQQMWIDGVFMGQMFLARFGALIGDRAKCFDEAVRQVVLIVDRLAKGSSGLSFHAYDESRVAAWADKETGLSSEVWSEGLGWYALILVELLALIDSSHPGRGRIVAILRNLAEGLARVQDPGTGLWYQVVDKGQRADNWHETSGSAMFVYAIQRAVELGCVSAVRFRPVAEKGYAGICTKSTLDANGWVDIHDACDGLGVQKSYEDYINYPRVMNAREAIGSVLWAAVAMEKPGQGSARSAAG